MATQHHLFARTVKLGLVHGYATSVAVVSEPTPEVQVVASLDDAQLQEAKDGMAEDGWGHVTQVPIGWSPEVVERLTSDAGAITGTGYTEVLSAEIVAIGGRQLEVKAIGAAAVLLATGLARLRVDGEVVAEHGLELLGATAVRLFWCKPSVAGTHTAALEVSAGVIGSVTPKAGTTLWMQER